MSAVRDTAPHPDMAGSTDERWRVEPWREIVAQLPDPHPFVTPEWQRTWWEHFGEGELSVTALEVGGEAGAVAALERGGDGVLRFLGGEDVTDYPGPAIAPGCAVAAAEALVAQLTDGSAGAAVLDVRNQRPEDGLAAALHDAAGRAGLASTLGADEAVALMSLPASWDDYVAGLPKRARHELRRKRRRLEREAPGAALRAATAETLEADLEAFFALHRLARGRKASFMTPRIEDFFRHVAAESMAAGTLRLDVLAIRRRALAVTFGFQTARTLYLYNMAFDPEARSLSPGIVLVAAVVERAIEDGLERFDFLRGLERYKLELGGKPLELQRVRVHAR